MKEEEKEKSTSYQQQVLQKEKKRAERACFTACVTFESVQRKEL